MAVLTAAYGRQYRSSTDVLKDYVEGKDFVFHDPSSQWNGSYCSCGDFKGEQIELRYGKNNEHLVMHTA